jgi:hypothetical protein
VEKIQKLESKRRKEQVRRSQTRCIVHHINY